MNLHPVIILALSLALMESVTCRATTIAQTDYDYPLDDIARPIAHGRTFVIGEDIDKTASHLIPALKAPPISLRSSRDFDAVPERTQKGPEDTSKETTPRKDRDEAPRGQDARITILFDLDSSAISDAEKARLSSFVDSTGAKTTGGCLSVTGYTCDLGGKAHNDFLAKERAEAVATYLRATGVYPSRVTGEGKCCYTTEEVDKRYLNRRVEVRVSKGGAAP